MQKFGKQPKTKPTHKHWAEGTSILDVIGSQLSLLSSSCQAFKEHNNHFRGFPGSLGSRDGLPLPSDSLSSPEGLLFDEPWNAIGQPLQFHSDRNRKKQLKHCVP